MTSDQKDNLSSDPVTDETQKIDDVSENQDTLDAQTSKPREDEQIDLDKEIADLDEILNEDDDLNDLSDDETPLTAADFRKTKNEKSGKAGKYVGYAAIATLLCGVAYAGLTYGPQFMKSNDLDVLVDRMENRANDMFAAEDASAPSAPKSILPQEEQALSDNGMANDDMASSQLPMAADGTPSKMDDSDEIVSSNESNMSGFGDPVSDDNGDSATENMNDNEVAAKIAEALDVLSADMAMDEDVSDDSSDVDTVTNGFEQEANNSDSRERIEVQPLKETIRQEETNEVIAQNDMINGEDGAVTTANEASDLSPLPQEVVEEAGEIVEMPIEALEDMVENGETTAEDEANNGMPDETSEIAQSSDEGMENDTEANKGQIKDEDAVKAATTDDTMVETDVAPKTAISQAQTNMTKPKRPVAEKPKDPRLDEARTAMNEGNFVSALVLYNAILESDPTNTGALTGQKMAQARVNKISEEIGGFSDTAMGANETIVVKEVPQEGAVIVQESDAQETQETIVETDVIITQPTPKNEPTIADLKAEIERYNARLMDNPGDVETIMAKQIAEAKLRLLMIQNPSEAMDKGASLQPTQPKAMPSESMNFEEDSIVENDSADIVIVTTSEEYMDVDVVMSGDSPIITEEVSTVDMTTAESNEEIVVDTTKEVAVIAPMVENKKMTEPMQAAAGSQPQTLEQEIAKYNAILAADPDNTEILVAKELAEAKLRLQMIQNSNRPTTVVDEKSENMSSSTNVPEDNDVVLVTEAEEPVMAEKADITAQPQSTPVVEMMEEPAQMQEMQEVSQAEAEARLAVPQTAQAMEAMETKAAGRRSVPVKMDNDQTPNLLSNKNQKNAAAIQPSQQAAVFAIPQVTDMAEGMNESQSDLVVVEVESAEVDLEPIPAPSASEPKVAEDVAETEAQTQSISRDDIIFGERFDARAEPMEAVSNDMSDVLTAAESFPEPAGEQVAALPTASNVPAAPSVEDIMMWDDEPVTTDMELRPTNMTLQSLLQRADDSPRDATIAIQVGDAYRAAGERGKAEEWYRKALQLDVLYDSQIDRMMVYDRLAGVR